MDRIRLGLVPNLLAHIAFIHIATESVFLKR